MIQRILTGLALIAVVTVCLLLGEIPAAILILLTVTLALTEELNVLHQAGHSVARWPAYAALFGGAALMAFYAAPVPLSLLVLMLLANACQTIFSREPRLDTLMLGEIPLLGVVTPGLMLLGLALFRPAETKLFYLTLAVAIAALSDTFALFGGVKFGRHKLCEAVSPKKTQEGALFGLLGAVVAGYATCFLFRAIGAQTCSLWWILPVSVLAGAASQLGDLFASMVKRYCGVKDFAHLFPGHGGMMDRMDSILFSAMVVYAFLMLV